MSIKFKQALPYIMLVFALIAFIGLGLFAWFFLFWAQAFY
jgi:hypothetical protein